MHSPLIFTIFFIINYVGARNPQNPIILRSINETLSYYISHYEEPFYNFILATMITKGRLLKFAGTTEVEEILDKCDFIIKQLFPTKWAVTPYAEKFIKSWSEVNVQTNLNPEVINYTLKYQVLGGHPTIKESDTCLSKLFREGWAPKMCSTVMTDPMAIGYTLSHQALYFIVRTSLFPWEKNKYKLLLKKLCSRMLGEQCIIRKEMDINVILKDLLIEQIILCGNYRSFTSDTNLEFIKSHQSPKGCFRFNNTPKSIEGCSVHLSSVSVAGLATYYFNFNTQT